MYYIYILYVYNNVHIICYFELFILRISKPNSCNVLYSSASKISIA